MIGLLLKFVLCSALLLGFYFLVLKPERMFKFNRFFLLSIVVISLAVPITIVKTDYVEIPTLEQLSDTSPTANQVTDFQSKVQTSDFDYNQLLLGIYALVALFLLTRFAYNLLYIARLKRNAEVVEYQGMKIVLRSDIHSSFSFLNHMYTNKEQFLQGQIPVEIIEHERSHIVQKHSLDILFLELMGSLFWFNPVIYFVKRAAKLNHEFLADAAVIGHLDSPKAYQRIILNYASQNAVLNPAFASHLTFGETKNRIKIMFKTTNKSLVVTKQFATALAIVLTFLALGQTKVVAQDEKDKNKEERMAVKTLPKIVEVPQDKSDMPPPPPPVRVNLTKNSQVRYTQASGEVVTDVYSNLSKQVRSDFALGKIKGEIWLPPPPPRSVTAALIAQFSDGYTLWVDGEKRTKADLKKYDLKDFRHYFEGTKRQNGKLIPLVELITWEGFENSSAKEGTWIPYTPVQIKEITVKPKKEKDKDKTKEKNKVEKLKEKG